jgi:hypothetical protein
MFYVYRAERECWTASAAPLQPNIPLPEPPEEDCSFLFDPQERIPAAVLRDSSSKNIRSPFVFFRGSNTFPLSPVLPPNPCPGVQSACLTTFWVSFPFTFFVPLVVKVF